MSSLIRHPKSGIYYAILRVNKKQVWRSLKTKNSRTAHEEFQRIMHSTDPQYKTLLSNQINEYLTHIQATKNIKTYKIYQLALKRFLQAAGDIQIKDTNQRHIDKVLTEMPSAVKNISKNSTIRAIKSFFETMKRWNVIQTNPMDGVKQIRVSEKIPAYLNEDEFNNFLEKIKSDRWLTEIVLFAGLTGARIGEIVNLTWKDVDLIYKRIFIQSSVNYQVKNGKIRTVPLNELLYQMLLQKQNREGYIFRNKLHENQAHLPYISRQFKKAVRKHGFNEELHFHSLRHSFASILAQKGVSLHYIQKLLGHSNISVTQIYSHLEPSNLTETVNMFQTISPFENNQKNFQFRI